MRPLQRFFNGLSETPQALRDITNSAMMLFITGLVIKPVGEIAFHGARILKGDTETGQGFKTLAQQIFQEEPANIKQVLQKLKQDLILNSRKFNY